MAQTGPAWATEAPVSDLTQDCLACHSTLHPGIVADWRRSRHASITPKEALQKPEQQRRISVQSVPDKLSGVVVGCAECHMLNSEAHKDTFIHNDQHVHVIVSPKDCATCHGVETDQYGRNIMAHAHGNLANNKMFQSLTAEINGVQTFKDMKTTVKPADPKSDAESCWHCHGTALEVTGTHKKDTDYGEMQFPVLSGWPNQGVGRLNPDGSMGACTPCHSRHQFSIEAARKPFTCSQCHKGPDVPAYDAYGVSKHGNLFNTFRNDWNFTDVPWTIGKDFTAPTCATCHASMIVDENGEVVAERTHQMNDRLPWRIFGLPYAHPHPISPDTAIIRNEQGQPLPTTLAGKPAATFLIDADEQAKRRTKLQKVCLACHSTDWVKGHWDRFEATIGYTNDMTLTGTRILMKGWDAGVVDKTNLFDEALERMWVEEWMFYSNSTRFASAMMGADYGVFANGRWFLSKNLKAMTDHLKFLEATKKK
jgi:hypothetical protein